VCPCSWEQGGTSVRPKGSVKWLYNTLRTAQRNLLPLFHHLSQPRAALVNKLGKADGFLRTLEVCELQLVAGDFCFATGDLFLQPVAALLYLPDQKGIQFPGRRFR